MFIPGNFYTCAEEDGGRCNQIITVYGHKDAELYQRAKNEPIPDDCAMPSPLNRSCMACYDHTCDHVQVICPEDVVPIEGECIDGSTLKLIEAPPLCMCHSHHTMCSGCRPNLSLGVCSLSFTLISLLTALFDHFCRLLFYV